MSDNIVLTGFMAVGKGRTARALARATNRFTIDTDDLLESFLKIKIHRFFAEHGEPAFRQVEQQVADWLEYHVSGTIISTGGGFFKVNNLGRIGCVVYLHSSLQGIISTVKEQPGADRQIRKRPLLQDMAKARELFDARLPLYREAADYEINVEGRQTSDIVAEIQRVLTREGVLS